MPSDEMTAEHGRLLAAADGNNVEDAKEYYFYLGSTPTHSYMKYLYTSGAAR